MKRIILVLLALAGIAAAGCRNTEDPKPTPPEFIGDEATGNAPEDLSGTWTCFKHQPKDGYPEPKTKWERWEDKLLLEKTVGGWASDKNGQGDFYLVTTKQKHYLRWQRGSEVRWFSINEANHHTLEMTGDDGWGYMFVRTEGGQ